MHTRSRILRNLLRPARSGGVRAGATTGNIGCHLASGLARDTKTSAQTKSQDCEGIQ
jgi:hypothetical protein